MSGRMPASATVTIAFFLYKTLLFSQLIWRRYIDSFFSTLSIFFPHSAVERRSGVTGVLTWPWCCLTSHTPWTWTLAPSPPWVTLSVGLRLKLQKVFILHSNKHVVSHSVCLSHFVPVQLPRGWLTLRTSATWWPKLVWEFIPRRAPRWFWLAPTTGERQRPACTLRPKDLLRQEYKNRPHL